MPLRISHRSASLARMTMADMAELADQKPNAIRLENADAYLPPSAEAIQATREAVGVDRYNSYLPLHGLSELRRAIAARYEADFGLHYDPEGEVLVTCGAGEAMLDVLLCYVNAGDKVRAGKSGERRGYLRPVPAHFVPDHRRQFRLQADNIEGITMIKAHLRSLYRRADGE